MHQLFRISKTRLIAGRLGSFRRGSHRGRSTRRSPLQCLAIVLSIALVLSFGETEPKSVRAQDIGSVSITGQIGGPSRTVHMHGGRVYTSEGPRFLVLEGCDPAYMHELGRSPILPGIVNDIVVRDNLAYVAASEAGLLIFDIARGIPSQVGAIQVQGLAAKTALRDNLVYVASGAGGMTIIDIANPASPQTLGHFQGIISDIEVHGQYAYVVSRNLQQIDIGDPRNPTLARKVEDWADAIALDAASNRLYVAISSAIPGGGRRGSLRIYDISDDSRPARALNTVDLEDQARELAYDAGGAYFQGPNRLSIVDVRGDAPRLLGRMANPDSVLDLEVASRMVWLAAGPAGLLARSATSPYEHGDFRIVMQGIASAEKVVLDMESGLIAVEDAGTQDRYGPLNRVLLLQNDSYGNPRVVGNVPKSVEKSGLLLHRQHLYIGSSDETLLVYEVSNPSSPAQVASLTMPPDPVSHRDAPIWRLAAEDDLLYVANDEFVRVFDISNPASLVEVSAIRSSGGATDIAVLDARAYVLGPATGTLNARPSIQVYDFFDLNDPIAYGVNPSLGFRAGIAIEGTLLAIESLQLLDVTDPVNFTEPYVQRMPGRNRDLAMRGGVVYLARSNPDGGGELVAFDLENPAAPRESARIQLADEVRDVAVAYQKAYLAARSAGLIVAETRHKESSEGFPTFVPPPTTSPPATPVAGLDQSIYLPLVSLGGLARCR